LGNLGKAKMGLTTERGGSNEKSEEMETKQKKRAQKRRRGLQPSGRGKSDNSS